MHLRYHGLRFHLPRRRSAGWCTRGRLRSLSHDQYRHARPRSISPAMAYQLQHHLLIFVTEPRKATVCRSTSFGMIILTRTIHSYYRLFMYLYAQALRRASFLMVNSSWTKNHIDSILDYSDPFLDGMQLPLHILTFPFTTVADIVLAAAPSRISSLPKTRPKEARIVYPPCDTRAMSSFPLEGRERIILSIAQFRCFVLLLF